MDLLVTYDIATPGPSGHKRLAEVAAICERYGQRVQYSVFECRLDALLLETFIGEITDTIEGMTDSVNIYRIGTDFETSRLSLGRLGHSWREPYIF